MFGNRSTKTLMTIHDDRAGEGATFAFPTMSSCAAVICVMQDRLVGIHKTQGNITGKPAQLFNYARNTLIHGDQIRMIVIAGWNATTGNSSMHSPTDIRSALGAQNVPAYIFNYATTTKKTNGFTAHAMKTGATHAKMTDLCTFVSRNGTGFPFISVKRSTKVTNVNTVMSSLQKQGHQFGSDTFRFGSVDEQVTSSHDHLINQDKFTQV